MKKELLMIVGAAATAFAITLSGVDFSKPTNIVELGSHASAFCTPKDNSDCRSLSTGNIYPGYTKGEWETEVLE